MPPMAHFNNSSEDLTTMWCDTRRLTKLHFPSQHQRLNNPATSPPTAIKFLLKRESRRMKTSTTMVNHDPRMNRTNPKISRVDRHRWYLKYLVWLLQLLVDCLVCFWCCLQLPRVFLDCVLLLCACACYWPLVLRNPQVRNTLDRKPL
jgi:hypothetical protein